MQRLERKLQKKILKAKKESSRIKKKSESSSPGLNPINYFDYTIATQQMRLSQTLH